VGNVSGENCRENEDTHIRFDKFLFPENRVIYDVMWKNIVEPAGLQLPIWRMRIAYWIPKATNAHL